MVPHMAWIVLLHILWKRNDNRDRVRWIWAQALAIVEKNKKKPLTKVEFISQGRWNLLHIKGDWKNMRLYSMCNPLNAVWSPGWCKENAREGNKSWRKRYRFVRASDSVPQFTNRAIIEPINQCQQLISAWHEYRPITVNIKHSYVHLLKGTAAGQSLAHSVPEGPFFHFRVIYCSRLKWFFSLFPIFSILVSKPNRGSEFLVFLADVLKPLMSNLGIDYSSPAVSVQLWKFWIL